jgi:hypothetical protein
VSRFPLRLGGGRGPDPEPSPLDFRLVARDGDAIARSAFSGPPVEVPTVPGADEVIALQPALVEWPAGVHAPSGEAGENTILVDEREGLSVEVDELNFAGLQCVNSSEVFPTLHGVKCSHALEK